MAVPRFGLKVSKFQGFNDLRLSFETLKPRNSETLKLCSSHQRLSYHVQGHGGGEAADAFAVAGEISLDHFCSCTAGNGVKDQANWFFRRTAVGTGYARDANAECRLATVADAFG